MGGLTILLVALAVCIVPFVVGAYLAKALRSPDSANGLGTIFFAIVISGVVIFAALLPPQEKLHTVAEDETVQTIAEQYDGVGPKALADENNLQSSADLVVGQDIRIPNPKRLEIKRGVDLSGGVILIYEIDLEKTKGDDGQPGGEPDLDALVDALARRINPGGVKEVVIRKYGASQVEIIIPDVDDAEVERIKRHITQAGYLRFLIIAKRDDHAPLFKLAQAQQNARVIVDEKDKPVGEWVAIAREEDGTALKVVVDPNINQIREPRPGVVEVLMAYDRYNVEGGDIQSVSKGFDDRMQPAVNFTMNSVGTRKFRGLTSMNLPDQQTGRESRLGIIMDDELISAPTIQSQISDRGQITGGFSEEYVEEMVNVLRAGKLPAVLKTEPITENRIDPLLGQETIEKGKFAIGASLICVLVFMTLYYRFAGLVACFALLLNLVLILALMIVIRGAFTLPGLAGLVLTVGMSVDANVLIFERIREELKRGAALRMAIRNGFGRATTTIVDANITTLITAVVLYAIGTDQLRGFAVTLILGILMSMFTAIYCSRVIFDLAERRRWLKKLTMTQLLDEPKLNLIGMRAMMAVGSVILVTVGLGAVAMRGRDILDIDFLGGTSVQAQLKEAMPYDEVWNKLAEPRIADDFSLTQVNAVDSPRDTVWKIDTSLKDNNELQAELAKRFTDAGGTSLLKPHTVTYDPPKLVSGDPSAVDTVPSTDGDAGVGLPDINAETDPVSDGSSTDADGDAEGSTEGDDGPAPTDSSRSDLPGYDVLAQADGAAAVDPSDDLTTPADDQDTGSEDATSPAGEGDGNDASGVVNGIPAVKSATTLRFGQRVTLDTLKESFRDAAESVPGVAEPAAQFTGPQGQADSPSGFDTWTVEATATPEDLDQILVALKAKLESRPAWRSSSKIGGKVAGNTQNQAIAAILISLVCIVGYLWIRFQRVVFGLSAVVALVHDVVITLGAIALSLYLSKALSVLLIDEFKISLPIVAAFLTIIGYSLNDTIVVFDRIREVKGRSPDITADMINTSINQTLSRTLLTSATTLLVVVILYVFGGQGIHGFAFALLIGVLVGTYSSIFVASPALLWMSSLSEASAAKAKSAKSKASVE